MTEPAFDLSAFLQPGSTDDAPTSALTSPHSALPDFAFDWEALGEGRTHSIPPPPTTAADGPPTGSLFFSSGATDVQPADDGVGDAGDTAAASSDDPFAFFSLSLSGDPSWEKAAPFTATAVKAPPPPVTMPPPSPLSPDTRKRLKHPTPHHPREPDAGATAPPFTVTHNADEAEEGEEPETVKRSVTADDAATPAAPEAKRPALNEEASTGLASATPSGPHATKSLQMPSSATVTRLVPNMASTDELVAQSRQRLERIRQREDQSRAETTELLATPAAGGGIDTSNAAFTVSCAQLTRQIAQTRAEQLRMSEVVQLRATRVLGLFGPHAGLASLLGPEYTAVPVVQLLPLLVPFFEKLLHET